MLKLKSFIFSLAAVFLAAFALVQAQTPNLQSPGNGATCVVKPIFFSWAQGSSTMTGVVTYKFEVSASSTFSGTLLHDLVLSAATTTFSSVALADGTNYWWRVGQVYSSDPSTTYYAQSNSFTTNPAAPTTLLPINGNSCTPLSNTLTWATTVGASNYIVQTSETSDYSASVNTATFSSTFAPVSLNKTLSVYWWRVRANVGSCQTDWSSSKSFTTVIGAPSATFPLNGAGGIPFSVDLGWDLANGALNYDIQVSTSSTFAPAASTSFTNIVGNTVTFNSSSFNTKYYWRTRSNDASCTSAWSNSNSFTTIYNSTTLTSPPNATTCVSMHPVFTWQPIAGAFGYDIQLANSPSFTGSSIVIAQQATTNSKSITLTDPSSTYYWRVRAKDSLNNGDWSASKYFVSAISAPALSSPVDKFTGAPIEMVFNIQNLGQITAMILEVSLDSNFTTTISSSTSSQPSRTVTLTQYNTVHYWRARSILGTCISDWAKTRSFTTVLGYPIQVAPAANATKLPLEISFSWQPVVGALSYDIEISKKSGTFTAIPLFSRSSIINNIIAIKTFDPSTSYSWRVRTRANSGFSPWSPTLDFVTGVASSVAPVLISPIQLKLKTAIDTKLVWHKSTGATTYRVQLSDDMSFTNLLKDTVVIDTTYKSNNLKFYTHHWWRVAATNASGTSPFSDAEEFRTIAFVPTDIATLLSPKQDSLIFVTNNILLKWSAVNRTSEYYTLSNPDGGYELNIATDANFSNTFVSSRDVWSTEYSPSGFIENVEYMWRVRGWNEAGNGPWSQVGKFKIGPISSVNPEVYNFSAKVSPTPAIENTQLTFTLPNDGNVKVSILDNSGRLVRTLANGSMNQGNHSLDIITSGLSSGSYFFNIEFGDKYQIGQFVITK